MSPVNNDTDVSDFKLVDDFYPENDRYAELLARRSMPVFTDQRRDMYRANSDSFVEKAFNGLNTLLPAFISALKPQLSSNIEAERLILAVSFAQIASQAANNAYNLQVPTRRGLIRALLGIPSAACDVARLVVNQFVPLGDPTGNLKIAFDFNSKLSHNNVFTKDTHIHTNEIAELKKIQADFKAAAAIETRKIWNVVGESEPNQKMVTDDEKKIIIGAFIEISRLAKDASNQVMPILTKADEVTRRSEPEIRLSYVGNILDKIFKSCHTKADILTSFVPRVITHGITIGKFFDFH